MLNLIGTVLFSAVVLLFITAALAPFESLGWWAGWYGEKETPPVPGKPPILEGITVEESPNQHFLVYFSGIGAMDSRSIPQEEIDWGTLAMKRIPQTTFVPDVYPYSVTNAGLETQAVFSRMWKYLEQRRLENPYDLLQFLINIRNMFQVAISADHRYGPIYNLGVAKEVVKALQLRGYRLGSGKPVTLLGFSGGGQISLGISTFLKPMLKAPIRIISVGGVMSDDIGVKAMDKLYHLWGDLDPLHGLGAKLYAGRWPIFKNSDWNKALDQGKIEFVNMGRMHHNGGTNYFSWTAFTPEGEPHAVATIDMINSVLVKEGLIDPAAVRAAEAATNPEARRIAEEFVAAAAAARAEKAKKKAATAK
ncbi:MAG: hypothetical protein HGA45_11930 [Chloroflexales bacterium]|nr:hypothetical protein [Chloroflexales bacterium]